MSILDENTLSISWQVPLQAELCDELISALQPHGVRLVGQGELPHGPMLLVLQQFQREDLATIVRLSRDGQQRLIVTFTEPAKGEPQLAWQLLACGAAEVLPLSAILADPESLCAQLRRWHAIDNIVSSSQVRDSLIGSSPAWTKLLRQVVEATCFSNAPLLLVGQSGTGKKLLGQLVNSLDRRTTRGKLIVIDCSAATPELAGSGLLSQERGVFVHKSRDGAFAMAHQGTLFLDNVDRLPRAIQTHLLHVLDDHTLNNPSSSPLLPPEFRLICASRGELWSEVEKGDFSRDLYYHLASWVFRVPNLAERREDIAPLARHFVRRFRPDLPNVELDPNVAAWLQARDYPGNIRDLRQLSWRLATRHVGMGPIGLANMPEDERPDCMLPELSWPDLHFKQEIERAVRLGFGPQDISRAAYELSLQATMCSPGSPRNATSSRGMAEGALKPADANPDSDHRTSVSRIEPVPRAPRKVVLRPAQIASHTEPMPSDRSRLPRPVPRNSDQEQSSW